MRVKAGGHFVDADNVNKNYTGGLTNLVKFYDQFDSVDILESTIDQNEPFKISSLMTLKKGIITAMAANLPDWVNNIPIAIERKHQQQIQAQIDQQEELKKSQDRGKGYGGGINR